jgi:acyl-CoA thioester hydrolase
MPLTHLRTFRVRHYECDAYGQVKQANYLRYMQEAAFDASAAAGYDTDRYHAIGQSWLIRETDIEYLHPLRYGDSVAIKTWVADIRRVRSRRAYELRRVGSGEIVARASTDWAYLDTASGRPVAIPAEIKSAFFPGGDEPAFLPRVRFPAAELPQDAFQQRRRVEWRDLDMVGHVNNAVYLQYIEDCGLQMMADRGWPLARLAALGLFITARKHLIEYRQPALLDDRLLVTTWIASFKGTAAVRHSRITRETDGAALVRARTLLGCTDLSTLGPRTMPAAFVGDLAPGLVKTEH